MESKEEEEEAAVCTNVDGYSSEIDASESDSVLGPFLFAVYEVFLIGRRQGN